MNHKESAMGSYIGWHGWGMGLGWLIIVLVVIIIIYILTPVRGERRSAKEILDLRYAKGEIDTKEYHERLKTLEDSDIDNYEKGG